MSSFVLTFCEFRWFLAASNKASRCLLDCLLFANKHVSDLLFKDWLDRNCRGKSLLIKAMTLEEIYVEVCVISPTVSLNFLQHDLPFKYNKKSKQKKKSKWKQRKDKVKWECFSFWSESGADDASLACRANGSTARYSPRLHCQN